jgi:HPt (histidine-containing phosphotransfer) domain-containing protein
LPDKEASISDTPDPMAEIRASFFIECEELLEALQDGLQTIHDGTDDSETINVVFRAVHSIKGGAGAFGLEALSASRIGSKPCWTKCAPVVSALVRML